MKEYLEAVVVLIIITNVIVSYQGFRDSTFFEKYLFNVEAILQRKEYYRLITSGFLHANWWHLIINMASLYAFSSGMAYWWDIEEFLAIYFGSMLAGDLLALCIHRNHPDYQAIGASGAISGVIFSTIMIFPDAEISFLYMDELGIPAWAFGIAYVLFCIYGIRAQIGNIGHEAHLGGAMAGVLISIGFYPMTAMGSPLLVAALLVPFVLFMVLLVNTPEVVFVNTAFNEPKLRSGNAREMDDEDMLNYLLEKINDRGFDSLSKTEKRKLEELSRKIEI